jgi:hypothetical protein
MWEFSAGAADYFLPFFLSSFLSTQTAVAKVTPDLRKCWLERLTARSAQVLQSGAHRALSG